jgi:DNA-binding transcriptional MerR regulator
VKLYTVKQLARLAGVSVRALHHYDEVGLLKPASIGENGYRYYGREELLRLQQILFHRELEFPLEAIAAVLAQPGFDRMAALRRHREKLAGEAARYRRLIRTLDETLAALEGEAEMNDKDLYQGFAPEKQAEYEDWLVKRGGDQMRHDIDRSKAAMKGWSKADWAEFQTELEGNEAAVAKAMADGLPPDSAAVGEIMRRRWAWVAKAWNREPEPAAFKGLGQLYLDHPDFGARYEGRAKGLTEYLAAAMAAYADRKGE